MLSQMIVRIDSALKKQVSSLAKSEGKNVSQLVRELLEGYVKNRDISAYVDDLWSRIGEKISRHGDSGIESAIREARSNK